MILGNVCLFTIGGGGYPIPGPGGGGGLPHPADRGYPIQVTGQGRVLHPMSPGPGLDGIPPPPSPGLNGVPPPQSGDRAEKQALATRRAVCRLRSRRRTFLYSQFFWPVSPFTAKNN